MKKNKKVKILFLDIETAPILAYIWNIGPKVSIGLNQIKSDSYVLSWSAKWNNSSKVMYKDMRNKAPGDDKELVKEIYKLMLEADVVCGQNSDRFDIKRLKARFAFHGLPPLPKLNTIDTLKIAKKNFDLTSFKLEYMCKFFNLPHKKRKSRKFIGMDLWTECLKNNKAAWEEMRLYNIDDVRTLEDLYYKLQPYGVGIDFNLFSKDQRPTCNCGSTDLISQGNRKTKSGIFKRLQCKDCGSWMQSKENLLSLEKRKMLFKKD